MYNIHLLFNNYLVIKCESKKKQEIKIQSCQGKNINKFVDNLLKVTL